MVSLVLYNSINNCPFNWYIHIIKLQWVEDSLFVQSHKLTDESKNDEFQDMINYYATSAVKEQLSITIKVYTKLIGSQKTSFKSPIQFHLIRNPSTSFLIDHTHYELIPFNALKRLKLINFVQSIISKNSKFDIICIVTTKHE